MSEFVKRRRSWYNGGMVCIAAFIILALVGVVVAFLSIFKPELGRKYLKVFKKSLHCFGKRVTLQKCDTNFQDDVKNALLKKVVIKHPQWVRPLSALVEVGSVVIVVITIWSLVEAAKAGLALWVFGTCNVSQPASCALGAEVCSIDAEEPQNPAEYVGRWFTEWGQIFSNIPDRLGHWEVTEQMVGLSVEVGGAAGTSDGEAAGGSSEAPDGASAHDEASLALDIVDPGCSVCMQSYKNQLADAEFIGKHRLYMMVYPIQLPSGEYKFKNSGVVARFIYAAELRAEAAEADGAKADGAKASTSENGAGDPAVLRALGAKILQRIFTEHNDKLVNYQSVFNNELSNAQAEQLLADWAVEWGLTRAQAQALVEYAHSAEVEARAAEIRDVVENQVHAKGIPTIIYDGGKHMGLYKK